MKGLNVPYSVAAPGALIGASNFFELAVATAIALFGPESCAALVTVVGVLVEVPVMLSICRICNRTRHWFPETSFIVGSREPLVPAHSYEQATRTPCLRHSGHPYP